MWNRSSLCLMVLVALCAAGCDEENPGGTDAGSDAGPMTRPDAGPAPLDAGGSDAGFDAGLGDAGFDAGPGDAGFDAGPFDGGLSMSVTFPPRDFRCTIGATRPCVTDQNVRTEPERTVDVTRDMPARTYTYAIASWTIPEASVAGTAAGFNVDSLDSGEGSAEADANCEEYYSDFRSLRDPGHEGIDNALEGLVPTIEALLDPASCPSGSAAGCLDDLLAEAIADGSFLVLVEITGVDSFTYDEAVTVTLYEGIVSGGGAPMVDGSGQLAPGQTFDTGATLVGPTPADIFDGRLRVRFPGRLTLPMTASLLLPLQLDSPEVRATASPTTLDLGVVGATTEVDTFVAQAALVMPGIEETVRSVLENVADVDPSVADPYICERLSSGYFFEAVSASRR